MKKIADRAGEKVLTYGTDEDAFGGSPKSVDPLCNQFDMGDDPIAYCEHKINLTKHLWKNTLEKFEKPGERYQKILSVFGSGWRSYYESARFAPRFVGGLHHYRHHVGDPNGKVPFEPVSAADQRRAIKFLSDNIFAADAFDFPADLLNRLQPERFPDFQFSVYYSVAQLDYPIHARVLSVQRYALSILYSPYILGRLVNNQLRYAAGADRYTMDNMFTDVRRSIWSEIVGPENVNSFRRQQQLVHLNIITGIYLGSSVIYPADARSLAANDLDVIETTVKKNVNSSAFDNITKVHFKEVLRQIEAAKGARRTFLGAKF